MHHALHYSMGAKMAGAAFHGAFRGGASFHKRRLDRDWINIVVAIATGVTMFAVGTPAAVAEDDLAVAAACAEDIAGGLPLIAERRAERFQGKGSHAHVRCYGGETAVARMGTPWVDWGNYWAAGDLSSKSQRFDSGIPVLDRNKRAISGALLDLEYQRMELIRFNLFDNRTFETYLTGKLDGETVDGATVKVWKEMRLPPDHPGFRNLKVEADGAQTCGGELIRFRTLTGICNDIRNPAMGSAGQLFARNVEFESTFPDLERNELARNRHGGRLSLLQPDPR
jgi:hypothetical protein